MLYIFRENVLDIAGPYKEVTVPVMEAFQAYENGDYDRAVEIMKPLKYEIIKVGGSHAQVRMDSQKKSADIVVNNCNKPLHLDWQVAMVLAEATISSVAFI